MKATTTRETHHGNPSEKRILPAGMLVELQPAVNLSAGSPIKYWASPLPDHPWAEDIAQWAKSVGVGLYAEDVELIEVLAGESGPIKGRDYSVHDNSEYTYSVHDNS
jgi:hypothetical protein